MQPPTNADEFYAWTVKMLGQEIADPLWAHCQQDAAEVAMQLQLILGSDSAVEPKGEGQEEE